ncbi:MAG: zinc ribbon domain-containing protein [Clostridiales bacterium]|uniref:zinc ribbon domain-containing protein n=1 Tax=Clostridium sp. N3C TaxID=1776758 RepID=UPI00092E0706|nr:zinc ribbon domain-containing protein [Clostridium sp. N3C]NLZ47529.1 zinc ribbon domain-containing protein [Clostridiales bacterium]SCN25721.1 putative membrane protein [Clostridium sp. N3C]
MFCEKCGAQLEDSAKFCTVCGQEVGSQQSAEPYINNEVDKLSYNDNGGANNEINSVEQSSLAQKFRKRPMFIGLAAVIVALVALIFGVVKPLITNRNPVNKLITAVGKLSNYEAVDVTAKIKLNMDGIQGAIFDNFAFVIDGKTDINNKKGFFNIGVKFKDNSIANISTYYDEKVIMLKSDELFKDTLFINIDDLNALIKESDLQSVTDGASSKNVESLKKFGKDLEKDDNFKAVRKKYGKFLKKNLGKFINNNGNVDVKVVEAGKEKNIKCNELTFIVNDEFTSTIGGGLLKELSEDNNFKALVKEKLPELVELLKENGALEASGFDMDKYQEFMKDFDKNWDEAMNELKTALDGNELKEERNLNTELFFRIDNKNRLRQCFFEIDLQDAADALSKFNSNGSMGVEFTFNGFDKDVVVEKPDEDGAINLAEMDEYQLMSLLGEMQENLEIILSDELKLGF